MGRVGDKDFFTTKDSKYTKAVLMFFLHRTQMGRSLNNGKSRKSGKERNCHTGTKRWIVAAASVPPTVRADGKI